MTNPFDAQPLIASQADGRYVSYTGAQVLTADQKAQAQINLGIAGSGTSGGVAVTTDPDGTTVLLVDTTAAGVAIDTDPDGISVLVIST